MKTRGEKLEYLRHYHQTHKAERKEYDLKNREKILLQHRIWQQNNPDKIRDKNKNKYTLERYEQMKIWRSKNPEKIKAYSKKHFQKKMLDPNYRLSKNFGDLMNKSIWRGKCGDTWKSLVPYTLDELKYHLESKFKEGMTWNNYGKVWHIDHIAPRSLFKFAEAGSEDFKRCWALDNLQPLFARENIIKSNKILSGTPVSILVG